VTVQTLLVTLVLAAAAGYLTRQALGALRRLRAASRPAGPGGAVASRAGCDTGCGCGEAPAARRWDELPS
jgi:hypothetical protein